MAKASLVVVLSEDVRHQNFIRQFLYRCNYGPHDIRFEPLPSARGSGEQWVRKRYASAVAAFRSRSSRAQTALIVAVDADTDTIQHRADQLANELLDANYQPRAPGERIVHLIPKRAIESWVQYLNGESANETTDYRNTKDLDQLIKPAAVLFYTWTRNGVAVPGNCLPSLKAAIPEAQRIA